MLVHLPAASQSPLLQRTIYVPAPTSEQFGTILNKDDDSVMAQTDKCIKTDYL